MNRLLTGVLLAGLMLVPARLMAARAEIPDRKGDPYLGAIVIDAESGRVLLESQPDIMVYPASVVKLMTMAVVLDRLEAGAFSLTDMVPVSRSAMNMGGSQVYLDVKEQFSVEDMLYALIIQSANDAALALAEFAGGSREAFVRMMNEKAASIGMKRTRLHSPHGLPPSEGQAPDITTARDISLLARHLAANPLAMKIMSTQERPFRNGEFMLRTHNKLMTTFAGCDGMKTGYYRAAGFSIAATAERNGKRVIAVVMGSVDKNRRNDAAAELLEQGFGLVGP